MDSLIYADEFSGDEDQNINNSENRLLSRFSRKKITFVVVLMQGACITCAQQLFMLSTQELDNGLKPMPY
jgi:hypothetical protein